MEPIPNFLEVTRRRPSAPLIRHGKEFWQQAVRDQETSGLSLSQFCLERGLAKATFFQWRKAHQYAVQHRNSHQKRMALRFTEGPKDSMWLETTNCAVSLSKQQLY